MKFTHIALACALAATASMAQAKPVWQDFSITGLYGENYELTTEPEQTTVTFEYAAKLQYGDVFAFADRTESGGDKGTYFEFSPRLSPGEVSGKNFLPAQLKMYWFQPLGKAIAVMELRVLTTISTVSVLI